jgi:hypothetical protein
MPKIYFVDNTVPGNIYIVATLAGRVWPVENL